MHILNIILFLFLKTVFSYSMQNTNTLDAMAKAGHDNKEGHPSSPSQLLSQLAGKKTGDTKVRTWHQNVHAFSKNPISKKIRYACLDFS